MVSELVWSTLLSHGWKKVPEYKYKEQVSIESKEKRYYIGFALITSVIDQENSAHPLNQSDVKLKKVTWLRTFPALAGLFLFEFTLALFPGKFRKKKFQVLSEPDHFKTSFPLFTFSLMLNHFFWIKSPPLFFFFLFFCFFFLLLQMAWRCFVTWQRMNRCSLAEETINLMCIGSWRKRTSTYCLTVRVALRKLSCLHCKCLSYRNLPSRKSNCLRGRIKFVSMAVNIWKSYIWTADKDVSMKAIFAVMNTT